MSLTAEFIVVVCGLVLALVAPHSLSQTRHAAGRWFRAAGRSTALTLLASFVLPLVLLPALTLRSGIPHPYVHDEFVYLLMGETFSRGELTNPTPEHTEHLRSPHLILEPTYQGKYPPAQGLFLAAGSVLTGLPIAGVWLSFACASVALCWMLRAWMPGRWALLGSVLFCCHPMISVTWGETYWGGAVAVLGGSLLFGAIGHLNRQPAPRLGVLLGLGLIILANSRPYEGLIVSLPAAGWFAWQCWSWIRRGRLAAIAGLIGTTTGVVVLGFALLGFYNQAVTGSAFKLPYQVWVEQTHDSSSVGDLLLDNNASRMVTSATVSDSDDGPVVALPLWKFKILRHHIFFLRVALVVPLLATLWLLKKPRVLIAVLTYGLVYIGVVINQNSGWPHYYAPATPLLFALLLHGIRRMSASGRRLRCLVSVCTFAAVSGGLLAQWEWSGDPYHPTKRWVYARAEVEAFLLSRDRPQLLLVRYADNHSFGDEWVWNTGRPEAQQILWAHSLDEAADRALVAAMPERTAWLLDVAPTTCRLHRYAPESGSSDEAFVFAFDRHTAPMRDRTVETSAEMPGPDGTHSAASDDSPSTTVAHTPTGGKTP